LRVAGPDGIPSCKEEGGDACRLQRGSPRAHGMFHPALVLVSSGFDRFFLFAISRSLPCAYGPTGCQRPRGGGSAVQAASGAVLCSEWVKVGFSCFFPFSLSCLVAFGKRLLGLVLSALCRAASIAQPGSRFGCPLAPRPTHTGLLRGKHLFFDKMQ
jgi:hypothetical protein